MEQSHAKTHTQTQSQTQTQTQTQIQTQTHTHLKHAYQQSHDVRPIRKEQAPNKHDTSAWAASRAAAYVSASSRSKIAPEPAPCVALSMHTPSIAHVHVRARSSIATCDMHPGVQAAMRVSETATRQRLAHLTQRITPALQHPESAMLLRPRFVCAADDTLTAATADAVSHDCPLSRWCGYTSDRVWRLYTSVWSQRLILYYSLISSCGYIISMLALAGVVSEPYLACNVLMVPVFIHWSLFINLALLAQLMRRFEMWYATCTHMGSCMESYAMCAYHVMSCHIMRMHTSPCQVHADQHHCRMHLHALRTRYGRHLVHVCVYHVGVDDMRLLSRRRCTGHATGF